MQIEQDCLHDALVDLASTMSLNPYRLSQVRQQVGRRRGQWLVDAAVASVGAAASAFGVKRGG